MAEQAVAILRQRRGNVKSLITKMESWEATSAANASLGELEVKLRQLRKYEGQFDEIQDELETLDISEFERTERVDFEEKLGNVEARLVEHKNEHTGTMNLNETGNVGNITVDMSSSELPKMDLPKFSGEYLEYPQFYDTFENLVHNQRSRGMTPIRKFGLLKSCLTGTALDTIKNLPLTTENYELALKLLNDRFMKRRLIFESNLRKLWDFPKATNTSTLRKLCDGYNSLASGIKLVATEEQCAHGLMIQLLLSKCDHNSVKKWEEISAAKDDLPTMEEFTDFLTRRCIQLESVDYAMKPAASTERSSSSSVKPSSFKPRHTNTATSLIKNCPNCKEIHALDRCPKFLKLTPQERYEVIKNVDYCVKCVGLPREHGSCKARCSICKRGHNTLLHFRRSSSPPKEKPTTTTQPEQGPSYSTLLGANVNVSHANNEADFIVPSQSVPDPSCDQYTFIATANMKVQTVDGNFVILRALLDGGSQLGLISEKARKLLGLKGLPTKSHIDLKGINNASTVLKKRVSIQIRSLYNDFADSIVLMVHPNMQQSLPTQRIDTSDWKIPKNLSLADTNFNVPHDVDIILNAHQSNLYLLPRQLSLGTGKPSLRETQLGWVVVGDVTCTQIYYSLTNACTLKDFIPDSHLQRSLDDTMQNFWEIEELNFKPVCNQIDNDAESHFMNTHQRLQSGRYMVKLPFSKSPDLLGDSRAIALKRFATIQRKCKSDRTYGRHYTDFMEEYISLGHCQEVSPPNSKEPHYYIPHFAVTNANSTTTQTRVVFDASCATTSGLSLNDVLMVGPKVQRDLVCHLLEFRCHPIVLTGDISKMYRQIDVAPEDRKFQMILWCKPDESHIRTYQLNTVTYGTASAPFQAVRAVQELARKERIWFPLAANIVEENFYVDDMLTGGKDPELVVIMYHQIKELLSRGQMNIRKFQSNSAEVLNHIPVEERGTFLQIGANDVIKTLGLNWIPDSDTFTYYYDSQSNEKVTKRTVLSEISRLFDPLGLVQPVVVRAKIFMQWLWSEKLDWDTQLPTDAYSKWKEFREELQSIANLTVPRHIVGINSPSTFEIHGFCDASQKAYGACLYIRAFNDQNISVRLLIVKSRVAPLKTVSLPRLELCGALLLAELLEGVQKTLCIKVSDTILWTDSTITLHWINQSPHMWTPFVANRVTKIQAITYTRLWRHVPSKQNPADLVSRGMKPPELAASKMWFNGPPFLLEPKEIWPESKTTNEEIPERKKKSVVFVSTVVKTDLVMECKIMSFVPLIKFAVWTKLVRVFGYVHRFINRLKCNTTNSANVLVSTNTSPSNTTSDLEPHLIVKIHTKSYKINTLDVGETRAGLILIIKVVQRSYFADEITTLQKEKVLKANSRLHSLTPFIDADKLMRVGGRLSNAPGLSFNEKYPILLPYEHPVTRLIFIYSHYINMHVGPSVLLSIVRRKFWPIKGKVLANQTVHNCITCSKAKPIMFQRLMADLPKDRVSQVERPFLVTAVDFAGPFTAHHRLRGSRVVKVYLAIFICFSTKAVHLELVEELTTEAFLNCLHRFTSRRGSPVQIWSDNATNFVGANRKLHDFQSFYFKQQTQDQIRSWCRDTKFIKWNFIPARSPHFNGLVEAAVKSAKHHLTRVVGLCTFTFQELNTIFIIIEGILNSRPLIPLACNPNDDQPLTPAHFLINGPIVALPEPQVPDLEKHPVQRLNQILSAKQSFWRRWSQEYLKTLQQRHKWKNDQSSPLVNDLVLLVEKDIAPIRWKIGKVIQAYPGKDKKVRVVDVQTDSGTYRRAITELCAVPHTKMTSTD